MKILVISFHYEPDLCAGSFRTTAFVHKLRQIVSADVEIEVVTTLPNRYATYTANAHAFERDSNLTIHRIRLPKHRSGMLDQAKSFLYFAYQVNKLMRGKKYSIVYATSSRLMAATLGAWVARKTHAKLYLDIRDLFVDTIKDVFPRYLAIITEPIFSVLEKWTFNSAAKINLVSKGFESYIQKRYPQKKVSWYTNGIDQDFLECTDVATRASSAILTVLYAGNIGEGQGLHKIIPQLAKSLEGRVRFKIIGDGGRAKQLAAAIQQIGCQNVELRPPVNRQELIQEYQSADVLFLHLNDYKAFRKVLPSKLFEYAAMGKPIWAGVAGYAADFIREEVTNAEVFEPCNMIQALAVLDNLIIASHSRKLFIEKYQRNFIMQQMAEEFLQLAVV